MAANVAMSLHAYAECARRGDIKLVSKDVTGADGVKKKKWYWNVTGARGAVTVFIGSPLQPLEHRPQLINPPSRYSLTPQAPSMGALIALRDPQDIEDARYLTSFWANAALEAKVIKAITSPEMMKMTFCSPFKEPSLDGEKPQHEFTASVKLNVGPPKELGITTWPGMSKSTKFSYVETREVTDADGKVVKELITGDSFDWETQLADARFVPFYTAVEINELTNISNKNLYTTLYASEAQIDTPAAGDGVAGVTYIDYGGERVRRVTKASIEGAAASSPGGGAGSGSGGSPGQAQTKAGASAGEFTATSLALSTDDGGNNGGDAGGGGGGAQAGVPIASAPPVGGKIAADADKAAVLAKPSGSANYSHGILDLPFAQNVMSFDQLVSGGNHGYEAQVKSSNPRGKRQ
jgi:hypothetical protein